MGTISTAIKQKLDYLSKLPETDYPFISFYMNIHSHQLFEQAEKNRIFIKDSFLKSADQIKKQGKKENLTSFKNDEDKIRNYIDTKLDSRAHGLVIFACDRLGVFEPFQSLIPFDNSFIINTYPHLRQLAYQATKYQNTLVIMIDAKYARMFNVKLGGFVINEADTESLVHRFHKEGGWAQARYQRHIENQVQDHYREIADAVTEFLDREHYENIILIGQQHEIKEFKIDLPKRVNMRVIDINHLQMRENINEILKTIINDLREVEEKRKLSTVKDMINKALGGGHESIGMQQTIDLANQGRVNVLATVKDKVQIGWKCKECFYTAKIERPEICPVCKNEMTETDLVEEAIRLTYQHNGIAELVEDEAAKELEKYEGIAAYLRY